ncbi:hypothetical protein Lalb_Chr00c29g0408191 (mitochondrion) [Lupinus albus]|uniref:Uncharacterized protein n=1 Tax=Lupinus albus TaxID=3870 RepID=A0A6A4N174_LUPAL|nr:hypothetical protein Lalb_Chr00c29g0408191 [Lupinus albus]
MKAHRRAKARQAYPSSKQAQVYARRPRSCPPDLSKFKELGYIKDPILKWKPNRTVGGSL